MKRIALIITALCLCLSFGAYAQMTDEQVVNYVKSAQAAGKSQTDIQRELLARGVTQAQAERIAAAYRNGAPGSQAASSDAQDGFIRSASDVEQTQNLPRRRRLAADPDAIFGHDMFDGGELTFEPNENLATPESYVLGPGDELLIEVFGYSEGSYSKTISPEGTINISQIGQVQLGGLTIKEAKEKLRKALVSKYASIGGSRPNSSVSITLRNIRTIQVNIMGEVEMPGTFRLSPFATVFNALYHAGGVSEDGSLRSIRVVRAGETVAVVDLYGYLFNGRSESDVPLKEGDIVIVPTYENLVQIRGGVKRPMRYEMKSGETLSILVDYAGGFTANAHRDDITVTRQSGPEREVFTVVKAQQAVFAMEDGDIASVGSALDRFANRVEVQGSVFRPGVFELGGEIATVRQLVRAAGGLTEDAFTGRAVLVREKEDLTSETLSIDLGGILSGKADDVLLRKNDVLVISANRDLNDPGTLTINGYVREPGVFRFSENTTVEDLILRAGGLLEGASLSRVDVARRVSDPYGLMPSDTVGQTFSFALKDGLLTDGGERFILQPYDVVSVRRSPAFRVQKFVSIDGEVVFPGSYVLLTEGERVSELVKRAGGPTHHAFLRGAVLTRQMNEEERNLERAKRLLAENDALRDTVDVSQIALSENYRVGIELDKAVARPGSEYDLILREGDRIFVPEELSTVRISGDVLYPNSVIYVPGKGVNYYIQSAGGYGARAKRSGTYIVYMNGRVDVASKGAKVEPGCEIIVPERPERQGMSTGEVMAMASAGTSMATMVATLVNLFIKK
jgi:protein involved in polysaccharide export with SLBB domain